MVCEVGVPVRQPGVNPIIYSDATMKNNNAAVQSSNFCDLVSELITKILECLFPCLYSKSNVMESNYFYGAGMVPPQDFTVQQSHLSSSSDPISLVANQIMTQNALSQSYCPYSEIADSNEPMTGSFSGNLPIHSSQIPVLNKSRYESSEATTSSKTEESEAEKLRQAAEENRKAAEANQATAKMNEQIMAQLRSWSTAIGNVPSNVWQFLFGGGSSAEKAADDLRASTFDPTYTKESDGSFTINKDTPISAIVGELPDLAQYDGKLTIDQLVSQKFNDFDEEIIIGKITLKRESNEGEVVYRATLKA